MSELKVNSIKGTGASTAAITIDSSSGGCTANITNNLTNRNLIINGAMQVAQRGTSSTSDGYKFVDRFQTAIANLSTGSNVTRSQQSLSSSDTGPFEAGFRKYARMATAAAGTANANAYIEIYTHLEAQNIANSGWDYGSTTKNITLSFWFRCSVNQTFYAYLQSRDGTMQAYAFSFTASGNNTWTKITKTISGNSNLTFDDNNGSGMSIYWVPFFGTDYTNDKTLDTWAAYDQNNQIPNMASTWLTSGAATWDITGIQLEVGSVATDFEHRSFAQELALCQRYFYKYDIGGIQMNLNRTGGRRTANVYFPTTMRDNGTVTITTQFDDGGATIEADNIRTYGFIFKQASSSASNDAPTVSVFEVSAEL